MDVLPRLRDALAAFGAYAALVDAVKDIPWFGSNELIATRDACHVNTTFTWKGSHAKKQQDDLKIVSDASIANAVLLEIAFGFVPYIALLAVCLVHRGATRCAAIYLLVPAVVGLCGCAAHHAVEWVNACHLKIPYNVHMGIIASYHWRVCTVVVAVQIACWWLCVWNKLPADVVDVLKARIDTMGRHVDTIDETANGHGNDIDDLKTAFELMARRLSDLERLSDRERHDRERADRGPNTPMAAVNKKNEHVFSRPSTRK